MTRVFVHHGIRIDITCRISYDPGGTYFVRSHCAREPEIWRKKIAFFSEKLSFNTGQRIKEQYLAKKRAGAPYY